MKIFLELIGCRLNQAELETLAGQFRTAGHAIVGRATEADLAVVNTCTVTAEAAADSRSAIRRLERQGVEDIIATGCWATLEPDQAAAMKGVSRIVPNMQKENLVADLLGIDLSSLEQASGERQPLPGLHQRTRAFIKAQDGCDNICTFCITRMARGRSRSHTLDQIIQDVIAAMNGGRQEIVLTGVQLAAWGRDLQPPGHLRMLVQHLLSQTSVPRLRLSSLEPWEIERDFFHLWDDPRLCRHLHLPLQSGSKSVLLRMGRKTSPEAFIELVEAARESIPEIAITTDVLCGFPGESEEEFKETLELVKKLRLAGGHVFRYSLRNGTPAAGMQGQVKSELIKKRSGVIRKVLEESGKDYRRKFLGKRMTVLWEAACNVTKSGWKLQGLTDNYLRVSANAVEPRWNIMDEVLLTGESDRGLLGEIVQGRPS